MSQDDAFRDDAFRPIGPPPRRWKLFAPVIALGVLALGLVAFWFYASRAAGSALDAWIERENRLGRVWTCAERSIAGFPFRLEVTCKGASFTNAAGGSSVARGSLPRILVVTQIYQRDLLLVEFDGPLRLEGRGTGEVASVDWDILRASIRGLPGAPQRISVDGKKIKANAANAGGPVAEVAAETLEAHLRRDPQRWETERAYDFALRGTGIASPQLDRAAGGVGGASLDARLSLTRAEPFPGEGFAAAAESWRTRGGRLTLSEFRFAKGDRRIEASGEGGIDARSRPEGRVELSLTGFNDLLRGLVANPQAGALLGLRSGGQNAIKLPLRADRGMLSIGPLPLFPLPPLY